MSDEPTAGSDEDERPEAEEEEREDQEYGLTKPVVQAVLEAVAEHDVEALSELLDPLHSADLADLIEQIGETPRRELILLWGENIDGETLSELDEPIREEVIEALSPEALSEAVRELDSDDVVDLVEYLEEDQQEAILEALPAADRIAVEEALSWPEESAGRLMQREVVRAPEHWDVGQMIDFMRAEGQELPEQFYHVILIDPKMHPVGYVALGRILASRRATPLSEIAEDSFRTVPVDMDEGEVAYSFNQYHLISLPVVDHSERLVGVITIDDAMTVLDLEAEEDLLRLAGVNDESRVTDSVWETTKLRFPWLAVNLVTAILASLVIGQFETVIAQFVALAVLMPIVASMGGNAGTQSLTVAVRAIATRDLTGSNVWRVIRRETAVGLLNGLAFAALMGLIGWFWFGTAMLGVVLALAMIINLVVAGLAGIMVPVLLDRLRIDPALASGAFVTTVTDVVGFFAFLGLAGVLLL